MRVYNFGKESPYGAEATAAELGGKGAGLVNMCRLGMPVPPGFIIPTSACRDFFKAECKTTPQFRDAVYRAIDALEEQTGRRLGDSDSPLLVSVRSGAQASMPGVMETILNVGANKATVAGLISFGGERFAFDSYRRFIEMFGEIGLGLDQALFAQVREEVLSLARARSVNALSADWLRGLAGAYNKAIDETGVSYPVDPRDQVIASIEGVFRSWNSPRAKRFRRNHDIADDMGTAVTVQTMVFGNIGEGSSTGVAFTRDPNTGLPGIFGEYLPQAQGEDVVSGRFTPRPIRNSAESLEKNEPDVYSQLVKVALCLEDHFRDVQDVEFTVESGQLWMLQTRTAKRTARAAVQIAVDMVHEGRITKDEALARVPGESLLRLLHPSVDSNERRRIIAKGLPASPGAVSGIAVFDADEAIDRAEAGETVILVRVETSTDDMDAIHQVSAILTSRGGMTSHAALVARGLGKPCVTGCADLMVDERRRRFRVRNGNVILNEGEALTIDGTTGEVILGKVETHSVAPPAAYDELMTWVDETRTLRIMANADNARAVVDAFENGADGIGLCCTEHMFLGREHLSLVREMVLAYDQTTRRKVLAHLLPIQREDFKSMLDVMGEGTVTIRLLDLPLHDLMPEDDCDFGSIAQRLETTVDHLSSRAGSLQAKNPILGHRGCRLGLTFPELYEVQVRALFEAIAGSSYRKSVRILVPFVTAPDEMVRLRRRIESIASKVADEQNTAVPRFEVGAMIESPRACLIADQIAQVSDFLLFGTNDLTIGTHLINRDDAGRFLNFYLEKGILDADPFVKLDIEGVGALIDLALEKARHVAPDLPIGLAGAHANHPDTITWCCTRSINYVTCAPHRLPMIRLAAAQAGIERTLD